MYVVGVSGGSGSGKTTLVKRLKERFDTSELLVITQDNYYRDLSELDFAERAQCNFDDPAALEFDLLVENLDALKSGQEVEIPTYSHAEHIRLSETLKVDPRSLVIVEGILIFAHDELLKRFDLKVFVDTEEEERLSRRIARDVAERGRSEEEVRQQFRATVKPMHDLYIEPKKKLADIIVPDGGENKSALEMLETHCRRQIGK